MAEPHFIRPAQSKLGLYELVGAEEVGRHCMLRTFSAEEPLHVDETNFPPEKVAVRSDSLYTKSAGVTLLFPRLALLSRMLAIYYGFLQ